MKIAKTDQFSEAKKRLAKRLRRNRISRNLSQVEAARILGISQSRLSQFECEDSSDSISVELLAGVLLALQGGRNESV